MINCVGVSPRLFSFGLAPFESLFGDGALRPFRSPSRVPAIPRPGARAARWAGGSGRSPFRWPLRVGRFRATKNVFASTLFAFDTCH